MPTKHKSLIGSIKMFSFSRPSHSPVVAALLGLASLAHVTNANADTAEVVAKVKQSVAAVGFFKETNNPRFQFRGTGFAVLDGNILATNAHVVQITPDTESSTLAVMIKTGPNQSQTRKAVLLELDTAHDLALLRFEGAALPALTLRAAETAREGQTVLFMGFPIGGSLGFSAVTHRGMISSITPVALPTPTARQLDEKTVRRLREGSFDIFQLDATAYPGNSGGPLFDPDTGEVTGVINMVALKGLKESLLSQPSGISYAIPAKFLLQLLSNPR